MIASALENNGAIVYILGRRLGVLEKAARENSVGRHNEIIVAMLLTDALEIWQYNTSAGQHCRP